MELTAAGQLPFQKRFIELLCGDMMDQYQFERADDRTRALMEAWLRNRMNDLIANRDILNRPHELRIEYLQGYKPVIHLSHLGKPFDINDFDPDPTGRRYLQGLQ